MLHLQSRHQRWECLYFLICTINHLLRLYVTKQDDRDFLHECENESSHSEFIPISCFHPWSFFSQNQTKLHTPLPTRSYLSPKTSHLLPSQAQNSFLICFPIFHFTVFIWAVFSWDYSVITASFQTTVLQLNCKLHSLCTVCIHQSIHLFIWEYVMIVVVFKSTVSNHKERAKEKLKFIRD